MSTSGSFAVNDDDDLDTCSDCRGRRLLEQWPDRRYMKCFYCPYADAVKKAKEVKRESS